MTRRRVEISSPLIAFDPISLSFLVMSITLLCFIFLFDVTAILYLLFAMFGMIYAFGMGGYRPWVGMGEIGYSFLFGVIGAGAIILVQTILSYVGFLQVNYLPIIYTLVAPFVEEAFFRGFLLNFQLGLMPSNPFGISVAFFFNSTIFAIYHLGSCYLIFGAVNMTYMAIIWASGYLLCYLAFATKGLIAPMIAHFFVNLLALKGIVLR